MSGLRAPRDEVPFSRRPMFCRLLTSCCSMPGFCSALLRNVIIWLCRASVTSNRCCAQMQA